MDSSTKKRALGEAIELAKLASDPKTGNAFLMAHPDTTTAYIETVYRKLCELHEDSYKDD
jgi:hypothetical protein